MRNQLTQIISKTHCSCLLMMDKMSLEMYRVCLSQLIFPYDTVYSPISHALVLSLLH